MTGEPRLGLSDGIIAEVLAVRYRDTGLTKLAENVVCQLIGGVRYRDRCHIKLHLSQFLHGDPDGHLTEIALLLVAQNRKTGSTVLNILCDHLQLQAVIQGRQNLFLRIVEIGNFIGRRKERDRRNGVCTALIGVLALVESSEQRVQHAIITFETLIKEHNVSLRNLSGCLHCGFILV